MEKEGLDEFHLEDIEDEDLKCSICHYYFTKNLKPYSLNCKHNLCLKCIDALIEKNMFNCPICRRYFSMEDRNNFKLNEKYLDFVTRILQLKYIFCIKCQKIFNFTEHFENCDQINFKDSHESFEDINYLAKDCLKIIKSSDRHLNILNNSEISIYEEIHRIMKIININFFELFNNTIEKFIEGITKINHEELIEEIFTYLKSYDLFVKAYKIESFKGNGKDKLSHWIENHINRLPFINAKNGETTPYNDNTTNEILRYNFANYLNFKEINNSPHINLNKEKYIDSENDSDYDFDNLNSKKKNNKDSKDIMNRYKEDNLKQIDVLFSKHKTKNNQDQQNKVIDTNKFKDFSSIKANKKQEHYNSEEELVDENVNDENSPFKINRNKDFEPTKNPLILSYNHYKLQTKNISNYNSKNQNNKLVKENNNVRKGYSEMHNNDLKKENLFYKNDPLNYNTNKSSSKHQTNNRSNVLSFSIDNILIKNFDKYQQNYIDSRKKSPPNFYTERKNHIGVYSKEYTSIRSKYNDTMKSESADSTYRNVKKEKDVFKNFNSNLNELNNKNLHRRFTNFSDNSNNTHIIEDYNFIDHFNNNNILSDSFSSISNEDINFVKGSRIKEKIQNINLNKESKSLCKNLNDTDSITINENDYGSINRNGKSNILKNNKNFSFKKSNKNVKIESNDKGIKTNHDANACERPNKSDNTIYDNFALNDDNDTFDNKEKDKFNLMLRNINISKNSEKDFNFIGNGERESLEPPLHKVNKIKEHFNHKRSFDNSELNNKHNKNNNKESDLSQRQKIIVRNDQVKIIHKEDTKKENMKITPSKIEIDENKIRLESNSPNTRFSNSKNNLGLSISKNKLEKENYFNDQISINNNISEGVLTIKTSYIDKYRFDNGLNKDKNSDLNDKRRGSHSKLIDMNALYKLSRNTSAFKSQNLNEFKLNENLNTNQNKHLIISPNPYSTKNINSLNKIKFEKENNAENLVANKEELNKNANLYDKIFNIAELKQKENNKFLKFLKNSNTNKFENCNLTQDNNDITFPQFKETENTFNSPFKNKTEIGNANKIIHTQKTCPNNNVKLIIGRDFQLSSNFKSNNNIQYKNQNLNSEQNVSEFPSIKTNQETNDKKFIEKENILIDNKKFDSFREIKKTKALNKHESFYNLLKKFNEIKEKVFRITNYSQQIELTSETLRDQISKNYSHLSEKISSNLNGICDNIIGTNAKNNYYKRIIPNVIENSKKICLFDIKLQTFDIKEFEYLTIKLNVSINIDHDGSDLIFLSGGKVNNSMNFFKGDESFGNLSGQITALFLILRWSTKAIELNGQLLRKRAWHSSLYFNNKLYIVGGASSENMKLKECECYNIIQKQWELLPNLNYARCNPGLCIYNQEYLYVFNGWISKDCFLDTIEFVNINHFSSSSWSTFKPEDPGLSWEGFSNCCAAVAAENKILIFGGYKNENESKTYFFDPLKKTVFRGKDLIKASIFYNNALFFENKIYSVDNKNENRKLFGVHVYDISSNIWKYYQGPQK